MGQEPSYHDVPQHRTDEKVNPEPDDAGRHPPARHPASRVNAWVAVQVTRGVGTMWCAYLFAALALVSLPAARRSHSAVVLVSWISQTFLQLVLLSVVIVGQNILAASADARSGATSKDADAVLRESVKLQDHLRAQDAVLASLVGTVARLEEQLLAR
jgi:hypothetical protein